MLRISLTFVILIKDIFEMEQFINEVWKEVSVNPNYLVSNYGRVKTIDHPVWCVKNNSYSIRKGRICIPSNNNSKKYWRIGIQINNKQKHFAVHRLVATAFIPNPNNLPQINHIDGNKDNNHISNLEWCDNSYNQKHACDNGLKSTIKMSEHSALRKLSIEEVKYIKEEFAKIDTSIRGNKMSFCKEMQNRFNLKSANTILWIINGGTNKHL